MKNYLNINLDFFIKFIFINVAILSLFFIFPNKQFTYFFISLILLIFLYFNTEKYWGLVIFVLLVLSFHLFGMLPNKLLWGFKTPIGGSANLADLAFFSLIFISFNPKYRKRWKSNIIKRKFLIPVYLIIILSVLQVLFSFFIDKNINFTQGFNYLRPVMSLSLVFVFLIFIDNENKYNKFVFITLTLGIISTLLAIYINILNLLGLPHVFFNIIQVGTSTSLEYRFVTRYGILPMIFLFFYLTYYLFLSKIKTQRMIILGILYFSVIYAIVITMARSIWYGCIIGIIGSLVLFSNIIGFKIIKIVNIIIIIIILLLLIKIFEQGRFFATFERFQTYQNIQSGETTFDTRLEDFKYSWKKVLNERAFFGFGTQSDKIGWDQEITHLRFIILSADNGYSGFLLRYGPIFGFGSIVLILISSMIILRKFSYKFINKNKVLILSITSFCISIAIRGFFADIGAVTRTNSIFLAIIMALILLLEKQNQVRNIVE